MGLFSNSVGPHPKLKTQDSTKLFQNRIWDKSQSDSVVKLDNTSQSPEEGDEKTFSFLEFLDDYNNQEDQAMKDMDDLVSDMKMKVGVISQFFTAKSAVDVICKKKKVSKSDGNQFFNQLIDLNKITGTKSEESQTVLYRFVKKGEEANVNKLTQSKIIENIKKSPIDKKKFLETSAAASQEEISETETRRFSLPKIGKKRLLKPREASKKTLEVSDPNLPQKLSATIQGKATFYFQNQVKTWEIYENELKLSHKIGSGAFGTVYLGTWRTGEVVIKRSTEGSSDLNTEDLRQFRSECSVMMDLRPHPNVVQFIGICTEPGVPLSLVTEYVHNGDLKHYLEGPGPLSLKKLVYYGATAAAGTAHICAEGFIHGDLAARNLLLTSQGSVKVADFGMTKLIETTTVKGNGKITGPLKWMAPECLQNKVFTVETDIWSFGITLYELFTRQDPYPDVKAFDAAMGVIEGTLHLEFPDSFPEALRSIIDGCLDRVPSKRPPFISICTKLMEFHDSFEIGNYPPVYHPSQNWSFATNSEDSDESSDIIYE